MAKIMLVEDDDNLREIYEARLAAEGYDIVTARNGEDALVVAKENKPDLIISDVMMPNISGFDMLDILRNTQGLHDAKVIMLTALSQADDKARAEKLGADRYLVKSQVTLEDIVNATAELLNGDQATAQQAAPTPATTSPTPVAVTVAPPAVEPTIQPVATSIQSVAQPQPVAPSMPAQTTAVPVSSPSITAPPVLDPVTIAQPQQTPVVASAPIMTPDPVVAAPVPEPVQAPSVESVSQVQVSAPVVEPVVFAPVAEAAPVANVPVVAAPAPDNEGEVTPVISMPHEATAEESGVTSPVAVEPTPLIAPEETTSTNISTSVMQPETLASDVPEATEPVLDTAIVQTATSEGAAVQQQIDNFVSTAPISTPEFDASKLEIIEPTDAEPTPVGNSPSIINPEALPTVAAEQPLAQPVAPTAALPLSTAPVAPSEPPTTRVATGGNKIIQPLSHAVENTPPSLDELMAREEGSNLPPQPGVSMPAAPATTQPEPMAQPPRAPQTSVFDPDDPASVAL